MKRYLNEFFMFCVVVMFAQRPDASAQTGKTTSSSTIDMTMLFKDRKETEKWLVANQVPALAVGYIQNGQIQNIDVYGELEKGRPAPVNAIFNVASLTKPVSALVALKLASLGVWDLDEPLYKYWVDPDIADDPRTKLLTTRIVLSHQTGFPNWRWNLPSGKLAFEFDPGTKFQYSGEGYEYMLKAIEKKTGKKFDQLAKELIFEPLQMKDTRYCWDSSVDETRFAKWHDRSGNLYETTYRTTASASDDLLTTVEDYCKFVLYILNHGGLKEDIYTDMISNQVSLDDNRYYGLGWEVIKNIGTAEFALMHTGADQGVRTLVIVLPKTKQGLVVFTNSDNGGKLYIPTVLSYLGDTGQRIIDLLPK